MNRVWTAADCIDVAACTGIRAAMDRGISEAAEILDEVTRVDDQVRRAEIIDVDAATLASVETVLDNTRARIAAYFDLPLVAREGTGFLRYRPGGGYRLHRDRGEVTGWPAAARRCIAVVLFLNSCRELDRAGAFSGGALAIYPDDGVEPVVIQPRAGTLVAFSADMLHEVRPVAEGVRDTAVDWFYRD